MAVYRFYADERRRRLNRSVKPVLIDRVEYGKLQRRSRYIFQWRQATDERVTYLFYPKFTKAERKTLLEIAGSKPKKDDLEIILCAVMDGKFPRHGLQLQSYVDAFFAAYPELDPGDYVYNPNWDFDNYNDKQGVGGGLYALSCLFVGCACPPIALVMASCGIIKTKNKQKEQIREFEQRRFLRPNGHHTDL